MPAPDASHEGEGQAPTREPIETPLAELHRANGAQMGVWFGCVVPERFSDSREEQGYANESVALIDKNYRAYFGFSGPDRVRYLNAILTNDIKGLREGEANLSLLLNPQGRILAEVETRAEADRLFCTTYTMVRESTAEWFEKYIIMDDVTLIDETDRYATLAVEGPHAAAVANEIAGVDVSRSGELESTATRVAGIPCRVQRRFLSANLPGAEFLVERAQAAELWTVLLAAVRARGGGRMGYAALSAQRLVQGVPWFGYDFGDKQIPHEAGLENSHISYTKGCYTGQEIVERVRSRGQVNRKRVLLRIAADSIPPIAAPLTAEDRTAIGAVTRAAQSWFPPGVFAMAYVRREYAAVGSRVQWNGVPAEVIAPPLS
jgi:folate-binding protein YgfZ